MAETKKQHMLSTDDNPYNPFEKFDEWLAYDQMHGHHSLELLARIARTTDAHTDEQNAEEIEWAIDEICNNLYSLNGKGLVRYIKITNS